MGAQADISLAWQPKRAANGCSLRRTIRLPGNGWCTLNSLAMAPPGTRTVPNNRIVTREVSSNSPRFVRLIYPAPSRSGTVCLQLGSLMVRKMNGQHTLTRLKTALVGLIPCDPNRAASIARGHARPGCRGAAFPSPFRDVSKELTAACEDCVQTQHGSRVKL